MEVPLATFQRFSEETPAALSAPIPALSRDLAFLGTCFFSTRYNGRAELVSPMVKPIRRPVPFQLFDFRLAALPQSLLGDFSIFP